MVGRAFLDDEPLAAHADEQGQGSDAHPLRLLIRALAREFVKRALEVHESFHDGSVFLPPAESRV